MSRPKKHNVTYPRFDEIKIGSEYNLENRVAATFKAYMYRICKKNKVELCMHCAYGETSQIITVLMLKPIMS
jgi:hypothetical protein